MELLVTSHADLGFIDPIGLSGGPVELPKGLGTASGLLLVAGHVRRGGWHNATRMTFFYACDPRPPFAIRYVTPLITFGFSASLEYLTHLSQVGLAFTDQRKSTSHATIADIIFTKLNID